MELFKKQRKGRTTTDGRKIDAIHENKDAHNIKSFAIWRESGNVDIDKVEEWKAFLASLCNGYTPADIFNMDETGYFYRALPNSTLNQVSKSCKGGKLAKDLVSVALTCSAAGEKLQPLIIGKSTTVNKNYHEYSIKGIVH